MEAGEITQAEAERIAAEIDNTATEDDETAADLADRILGDA